MKFEAHAIWSLAMSSATPFLAKEAGVNLSTNDLILILPAIVLGGTISCDIDTNSKASRYYAWGGAILTAYWAYSSNYEYIWLIWIPFIAAKMFGHRKWTHRWLLPLGIICLPWIIEWIMFYSKFNIQFIQDLIVKYRLAVNGFALGILTGHLLLDIKIVKKIVRFIGGERAVKALYG